MDILRKLLERLKAFHRKSRKLRKAVLAMSCVIVFVVTYALILPALTLDSGTADSQPGISVETAEESSETLQDNGEADTEEESSDESSEDSSDGKTGQTNTYAAPAQPVEGGSATGESSDNTANSSSEGVQAPAGGIDGAAASFTYEGEDAKIDVVSDAQAALPEDTVFEVTEIRDFRKPTDEEQTAEIEESTDSEAFDIDTEGKTEEEIEREKELTSQYIEYQKKSEEALQEEKGQGYSFGKVAFYDFAFTSEGQKVEAASPVEVTLSYANPMTIAENSTLMAIHFEEGKDPVFVPVSDIVTDENKTTDVKSLSFQADSFSVWAIAEIKGATAGTLCAEGYDYVISVNYEESALLPEGTVLNVREVAEGTEEYQYYHERTEQELETDDGLLYARFFDVSLTYNGKEIEPLSPVSVTVSYTDPLIILAEEELKVIHFTEKNGIETPELLDISETVENAVPVNEDEQASDSSSVVTEGVDSVESEDDSVSITEVTFEQPSFSVVGTVVNAVSDSWPNVSDTEGQIMIVKGDSDTYYAVKKDGSLVPVTVSVESDTITSVTFKSSDVDSLTDLEGNYYWYVGQGKDSSSRRITNGIGSTLMPFYNNAIYSSTPGYSLRRDNSGHIYYYYYSQYRYYYYLGISSTHSNIKGGAQRTSSYNMVDDSACEVYFAHDFSVIDEEGNGVEGSGVVSAGWPSDMDSPYVMVVTADDNTYYAVTANGTLTVVTPVKSDGNLTGVVFDQPGNKVTTIKDLRMNYYWYLENHASDNDQKQIGNLRGTEYIKPSDADGITTNTNWYVYRDNAGHIYNYDDSDNLYHYLGIDTDSTELKLKSGSSVTNPSSSYSSINENSVKVYFVNGFVNPDDPEEGQSGSSGTEQDVSLDAPETNKTLTPHNATEENPGGDGSYDLSLSITGEKEKVSESGKADVIIIFDISSSMVKNNVSNGDTRLVAAQNAIEWMATTLCAQNTSAKPDAVRLALITFGNQAKIEEFGSDHAQFTTDASVFTGVSGAITESTINARAEEEGFKGRGEGTNWEDALEKAYELETRDDASKYVIFVSDGDPTLRNSAGDYYGSGVYYKQNNRNIYYTSRPSGSAAQVTVTALQGSSIPWGVNGVADDTIYYNYRVVQPNYDIGYCDPIYSPPQKYHTNSYLSVYGTGSDHDTCYSYLKLPNGTYYYFATTQDTNIQRCYEQSRDNARSLVRNGLSFYSVNVGSAGRMSNLVKYVYTNSDNGTLPASLEDHYQEASDEDSIEKAFANVVNEIVKDAMYAGVSITDGLTNLTMSQAKAGIDLKDANDDVSGFTYYRYGGYNADGSYGKYGTADNPQLWTDKPEYVNAIYSDGTVTWTFGNNKDSQSSTGYTRTDDENRDPADFYLEDGVTYVVKFRVWPDQEAYDALAAIRNSEDPEAAYEALSEDLKAQIVVENGVYSLKTNTEAKANYDIIKQTIVKPDDGTSGISFIKDNSNKNLPDPGGMPLTGTKMTIAKEFLGDSSQMRPESVTLNVYQTDDPQYATHDHIDTIVDGQKVNTLISTVTLPNPNNGSNIWYSEIHIAPALIVTNTDSEGNTEEIVLEPGHYYWVDETQAADSEYSFIGEYVHPYLKNSASDVMTDEDPNNRLTAINCLLDITIKKADYGSGTNIHYLNGAHFKLTRKNSSGEYVSLGTINGINYDDFTVSDGETGLNIDKLQPGEYKLEELSAPAGYIITSKIIYFKMNLKENGYPFLGSVTLNKYIALEGYETDSEVIEALVLIKSRGQQAMDDAFSAITDVELKNKIEKNSDGVYVAKTDFVNDATVQSTINSIAQAGLEAEDAFYQSENTSISDAVKGKIYAGSDVTIDGTDTDGNVVNDTITIKNRIGSPLPNTGGKGTKQFAIIGSMLILMAIAGYLGMMKRHKNA